MFKLIYSEKMPTGVRQFLTDQLQWSRNQTLAHAQDPYWQQLGMGGSSFIYEAYLCVDD